MTGCTPDAAARLVLVHGTFAPRSRWTFPDSALSQELRRRLPEASIERFQWSGANLHRSRAQAARSLAGLLAQSSSPTIVVAHSHGGNVGVGALSWLDVMGRTGSVVPPVRLVTVGTPYLVWKDQRHGQSVADQPIFGLSRLLWLGLAFASSIAVLIGLVGLGVEPSDPATADDFSTWGPLNPLSGALGGFAVAAVGSMVLPLLGVVLALTVASVLLVRFGTPARPAGVTWELAARIVTIRTRGDEAAGLLHAGRLLTGLASRLRLATDRLPTALAFLTFAFAGWLGVAFVQGGDVGLPLGRRLQAAAGVLVLMATNAFSEPWGAELLSLLAAVLAMCGALGLTLGIVTVFEAIACGFDGLPLLAHGHLGISPMPPGKTAPVVVELGPRVGLVGLRHSRLMNDPNSIDAIAKACLTAHHSMRRGGRG